MSHGGIAYRVGRVVQAERDVRNMREDLPASLHPTVLRDRDLAYRELERDMKEHFEEAMRPSGLGIPDGR